MKLGLLYANIGPGVDPEGAVAIATRAEEVGFESLWTVEHVVVPGGYVSRYPYDPSGRMPGGEDAPIPDPLVWLAYVAARTGRIVLGTGMLILPQRSPVVLAKEAATLSVLCRGRLVLGVGLGWLREEFEAIGVPFAERGRRTDEWITAMRALWSEDQPSFHGEHVHFEDARLWPKPTGRSIPIVIGGHSEAAARRAGRIGDGFFPGTSGPDQLAPLLNVMRRSAEQASRDPDTIEVTAGGSLDPATLQRFATLGVSRIVTRPRGAELDQVLEGLKRSAETFRRSASVA
jgi:probable F420-dependent oxidoreductase